MKAGGEELADDCDEAMRLVLRLGLLEIRSVAATGHRVDAEGASDGDQNVRDHIFMLANLLHHVPSYVGSDGPKMSGPLPPPYREGRPGFNWLCSLWQFRSETQEAWLGSTLANGGYTVGGLIGPDALAKVESHRDVMRRRV
ncbi:hypothetical protein [Nocardioides taihuensis]|uniref:Uncharacterized protein n=1 Tax=Nocardioides taihuensis TaxID=1835606 RepID=A0ABW0BI19_9ACTN